MYEYCVIYCRLWFYSSHLVNRETGKFLEKIEDVNLFIQVAKKGETTVAKQCGNLEAILSYGVHVTLKNVYECDGYRNLAEWYVCYFQK